MGNSQTFPFEKLLFPIECHTWKKWNCHNPSDNTTQSTTQPQHCGWVERKIDGAQPTHPPHHPTTETQQRPSGASD